ncbi:hypothetical protein IFT48_04690 [Pseudomonas fluorescens]|uniref:hypothetical protein n=1 Tax=Pseudomonas fluorescens TaxID=294 RepID=UPI0017876A77|nr:hypothetical protein [Pseudomonas fluorescens]MBD8089271.1 hypothetical protein [Pseudomonas fluorescens]MBD8615302.1 hypothetical protein [Pseudomonas putida]
MGALGLDRLIKIHIMAFTITLILDMTQDLAEVAQAAMTVGMIVRAVAAPAAVTETAFLYFFINFRFSLEALQATSCKGFAA